jgi:hypothetical protein
MSAGIDGEEDRVRRFRRQTQRRYLPRSGVKVVGIDTLTAVVRLSADIDEILACGCSAGWGWLEQG